MFDQHPVSKLQAIRPRKKNTNLVWTSTSSKLVKESHNRGYVVPFHKPTERVHIQGRSNIGKAFTGDEVVIQAATKEQSARVVGVIKENQSARELVCFLEEQDHSRPPATSGPFVKRMMIPINKSATKIAILIKKDRRNFLPIWEQNDEQWTIARCQHFNEIRDKVFLVQVIGWKDGCFYPLGKVTDVLSSRGPFNDRLWLLKEEFGVKETTLDTYVDLPDKDENSEKRQNKTNEIAFTIDPERSKDLDDAISVGDAGTHYELGIHIADVASYVRPGDELDRDAEEQGSTQYTGEEPIHMFPKSLSTGRFSLLPHQDRRAVSLMIQVEKETHRILEAPTFQFSVIRSKRQFTYEEAEDIINQRYRDPPAYSTVEDCVTVAYHFAKAQRKLRLASDWPYYQSDDDRLPGKRKAHQMIEEISLFFNSHAAKYLCESTKARYYTPLRCQSGPEPERVEKFKDKCGPLLQLSFALRDNDEDKLVDLVLQRCHSKAYYIRSNSTVEAKHGHYSLRLNPYSQASSPIRRYMDLVLQRLLHSFICDSAVPYTRTDITDLCHQFEPNAKKDKQFEQKAQQISYAVSTKKQSAPKLAFAVSVEPEDESLKVTFPFNRNIFHSPLSILITVSETCDPILSSGIYLFIFGNYEIRVVTIKTIKSYFPKNKKVKPFPCVEILVQ
uniref:RNB domain-containing protein n=1 Tax=Fundulus heteroclitus TaxID=8078 RepID=A0A3Q2PT55_FUNHE